MLAYANHPDNVYGGLLREVMGTGEDRPDRTGTGRRSVFGAQLRFQDIGINFPLLTSKKIAWVGIVEELFWFLRAEMNIRSLQERGVHFWDPWAEPSGYVGPLYGVQWRQWRGQDGKPIDQLRAVIQEIRTDPWSRRMVVSAWNVSDLPHMALPPCHLLFQFNVGAASAGSAVVGSTGLQPQSLSLHLYMRSADLFIGVPFNIASYALLLLLVARTVQLTPGDVVISYGDVHIYLNHFDQVREQLQRIEQHADPNVVGLPRSPQVSFAQVHADIDAYRPEDIVLHDYHPLSAIKAPVAV